MEIIIKPSKIRFTQNSVAGQFHDGLHLNSAIERIRKGTLDPEDFPYIRVVRYKGNLYSFNNRRLYVYRVAEYNGWISEITAEKVGACELDLRKFTTKNNGVTVRVRQGDTQKHYRNSWMLHEYEYDDYASDTSSEEEFEIVIKPSQIRFTRNSVAGQFHDGLHLNSAIKRIRKGTLDPEDFPYICVVRYQGNLYSFNNRRLYVYRVAEYNGWISEITAEDVGACELDLRKFTTKNNGVTVRVRHGGTQKHYRNSWMLHEYDDYTSSEDESDYSLYDDYCHSSDRYGYGCSALDDELVHSFQQWKF